MSQIYDLLEDFLVEYQEHHTPEQLQILVDAADKVEEAFESDSLAALLKKLRQAAKAVRELDDEAVSFLFDFHLGNELIGTAHRAHEGIEVLRPAAIATRDDAFADSPLRLATNNMLATAFTLVDPAGYADEIRLIDQLVADSPIADEEDRLLSLGNRFEAEMALGDVTAAKQIRDEMWTNAKSLNDPDYFMHMVTFDCDLAYVAQDWNELHNAVERVWKLGKAGDEEDTDRLAALGAHALALAKLGRRALAASQQHSKNPHPERPAGFPFFRYWCDYHLEVGQLDTAVAMAKQGYKEIRGLGQDYIEIQMLCVLIRALTANGQTEDVLLRVEAALTLADRLKDPTPMKELIAKSARG
jgi:hypothetical protein